jgi:hypothetical protein
MSSESYMGPSQDKYDRLLMELDKLRAECKAMQVVVEAGISIETTLSATAGLTRWTLQCRCISRSGDER